MKIPQTPPFLWAQHLTGSAWLRVLAEVAPLLPKMPPDDYLHWDKIRYRPLPDGFASHDKYWKCLKIVRLAQRMLLPLAGKGGITQSFALPDEAQSGLSEADSNLRGLTDVSEPLSPTSRDRWLVKSLTEDEAIHSSLLEGAGTTRSDAKKMLREKRKPRNADEHMVLNNYRAMEYVRERKDEPLSEEMLCRLHRIITENTTIPNPADIGRFRTKDNNDFGVWDNVSNRMLYGPPPVGELPGRMRALCEFANAPRQSRPFIHPVVRAIILHFQIGHDHPFVDGNGRTARALFYWLMLKNGYWLAEYVSISGIVLRSATNYKRAFLYAETDDGDLTYFILHQLKTLARAVKEVRDYLDARARQIQNIRPALRKLRGLNPRQIAFLEYALKHASRGYSVSEHQVYHGVVARTARTDLHDLVRQNYLEIRPQGKTHFFYPTEKLTALY